jgi:hypothetical protein
MVRFLTTRGHEYTAKNLAQGRMHGATVPPCTVENYDQFLRKKDVPCGAYIFTDMERLTPYELRMAAEAYSALAGDGRCRVLNNPARVMSRYELLRNLREEGINEFDVIRADERRWPDRYPVFLRHEQNHRGPLSKDLMHDREELAVALKKTRAEGISLRGLLIVGYAAEAFEGLWFRKFNTFRVGKEVFAHHMVAEDSWVVKFGKENVKSPQKNKDFEQEFVKGNWNADLLRRVFEIAGIEYGRADWGIVAGRTQVYEINTNPHVSADPQSPNPIRRATLAMSTKKLCESLAALENGTREGKVKIGGKLLDGWRNGKKWYERAEKRPWYDVEAE